MAIELNDLTRDVLESPSFGFIGTLNDSGRPIMTRFFGFKNDDPLTTLTVYTFKKDAERVIQHLSSSSKMTATSSKATDFKTVQFKGTYLRHYDVLEDEMVYARKCNEKQAEIMSMFGIPKEVFTNWNFDPAIAIEMKVDTLFDQTPRANTGNKIN